MAQPDLWARIMEALRSGDVDAGEFETAAFVFLKASFPTLSPVSGGTDFGRDADAVEGGHVVRLLATTASDPRGNLRTGLRRMCDEGLPFENIVLATSQPISATRRRQLEKIAEDEFGARLQMVYDQTWLAGELYRDAMWRERLIGVTGEPPALTPVPLSLFESQLPSVDIVGRNDAVDRVRGAEGDLIVLGASGMGKTRLVAEVDNVLFVEMHNETARIADDIRRLESSRVIVDDAHDHLETLDLLRRIRASGPPPFRIIATTWPETVEAVRDHLPGADKCSLEPLERSESAQVLEALGITNQLLIGDILDQAEGRPGWTLLLGDLARQGGVERVVTGAALIEQVGRFTRRLTQGPVALDLLARIAALGHVADEDVSTLSDDTGLPIQQVSDHLRRLARHGLVEWSAGRWTVRPARLRAALVAHHFFSEPPAASIDALITRWSEKTLAIVSSVLSAAHVGSIEAHQAADALVREIENDADLLGDEAGDLLYSYALTSRHAAMWIVEYLDEKSPNGPPSPPADAEDLLHRLDVYRQRDRWGRAAAAAEAAAQKFALPEAFDRLARMALQDEGRTNHSDHPWRRLLDLPTKVGPYWGTKRELRREALQCAVRLLGARDAGTEELAAELASAAMSAQGRGSWLDPVDRRKFTWVDRLEDAEQLKWIADSLWPVWRDVIDDLGDASVGKVLELARTWQRLTAGGDDRLQATEEAKNEARRHILNILRDIRNRCRQSPGLATEWNARFNALPSTDGLERIQVDEGFAALVPDLDLSWRERETERRERIRQVADQLEAVAAPEVAERIDGWVASAEAGGQHIGMAVAQLLEQLGKRDGPTPLLLEVLATQQLRRHAYALAAAALEMEPDRWREWVPGGLDDLQLRGMVASAVLEGSAPDDAVAYTLDALEATDAWMLEGVLIRRETADAVVEALLTHNDPLIRSATALEFRVGDMRHGLDVSDGWYDRWRDAFLETPSDLSGHSAWRFEEVAKGLAASDPDLLTVWFIAALGDTPTGLGPDAIELVGELPREHRRNILAAAAGHTAQRWLVCSAIGRDAESVPELLDEDVIDIDDAMLCIERDRRGPWFETVAPELVRRGASPREVAGHLMFGTGWGEQSDLYTMLAEYLGGLVDSGVPELAEVAREGQVDFRQAAAEAAMKERENRIRGR